MLIGRFFRKIQGTRSYMSPEQIRGQPLDERADIYSFGCVVYELLSGKLPFTGVSTADLLNKHLRFPPPPIQAANRTSAIRLLTLIKRMMAKSPRIGRATWPNFCASCTAWNYSKIRRRKLGASQFGLIRVANR